MDWKAAFASNWPYKLAALSLSLLLWFAVTSGEERRDLPVRTSLQVEVTDSAWVAVRVPREVRTTFQGRSADMFALIDQPAIRKVIETVDDTLATLELSPSDVTYDRTLNVQPIAVQPSQIDVHLEPVTERRVPVLQDVSISAAEGFAAFRPIVQPESVTVRGAQTEVESLTALQTESARFNDLRQTVTRQLAVILPQGLSTVDLDPSQVLVTIEVDSLTQRQLVVQVRATGPGSPGVVISPASVRVILRGARAIIQPLTPADIDAVVTLASPLTGPRSLAVEVLLPDGLEVTATPDPRLVTVSPRENQP